MNCQEGMELMQRHVDDDLNEQETSRLMDHVGHCPDCAAMLDRLVLLSKGLEQLPRIVPPYSLVDAIMPELIRADKEVANDGMREAAAQTAPRSRRAGRARWHWATRVSGVVALGIAVGLLLFNGPLSGGLGSSKQDKAASPQQERLMNSAELNGSMNFTMSEQYGEPESAAPAAEAGSPAAKQTVPESEDSVTPAEPSSTPVVRVTSKDGNAADVRGSSGGGSAESLTDKDNSASGSNRSSNESDSINKGLTVNPTDEAADPPMSLMAKQPTEEALSPDGQWNAVLTDGKLQLFRMSDGNLVYDQTPDLGKRSVIAWSEDGSALNYTYTDVDGNTSEMSLLVPEMKEIKR